MRRSRWPGRGLGTAHNRRWPHELPAGWESPLDETHPTLAGRLGALGYETAGFVAHLDDRGRETGVNRGFAHYQDDPLGILEVFTRYIGLARKVDRSSIAMVADFFTGRRLGAAKPLISPSKEHVKSAADVDRSFLDWLFWQGRRDRPFFAFLNDNGAHSPCEAPDESAPGFGLHPGSWHDRPVLPQWNIVDKRKIPLRAVRVAKHPLGRRA